MISDALSMNLLLYLLIPAAFLIGSIPFGIIFTRSMGIDITSIGSRNIGATNVLRTAGKTPAVLTLLCDILKGAVPVIVCKYAIAGIDTVSSPELLNVMNDLWPGIVGLSAVLGHMFSVFLGLKGGKGVATGLGVLIVYSPAVAGIMLLVWISVAIIFKYSSLAALVAVSAMPVFLVLLGASHIKLLIGIIIGVLIIYKHKSNIQDLISGTESRIGKKG